MRTVTLQETDARGRSSWFRAKLVEVWTCNVGCGPSGEPRIHLDVWSRRRGEIAPVILELSPEDARALGEALLQETGNDIVRYTIEDVKDPWNGEIEYYNQYDLEGGAEPLRTWGELEETERQKIADRIADAVIGSDIIPEAMHEGILEVAQDWIEEQRPKPEPVAAGAESEGEDPC